MSDDVNSVPLEKNQEIIILEKKKSDAPKEIGGVDRPEPTRFGDWEKNGRCIDF